MREWNISFSAGKINISRAVSQSNSAKDGGDSPEILDDVEIGQAEEFLLGLGYTKQEVAAWRARGSSKIQEIAEAAGFKPFRDGGDDLRASEELRELASAEFFKKPLDARINRCHELRLEWEGILAKEQISKEDVTRMQVITTEIISLTPFESDINTVPPQRLIYLYQQVAVLSEKSYEKTKIQAAIEPDPSQSRKFLIKTAKFAYCAEYGRLYQRLIRLLNVVMFYRSRLPQPSPELEKGIRRYLMMVRNFVTGVLNLLFPLWGFTLHDWLVSPEIPATRTALYDNGNLIVPGLYLSQIETVIPSDKTVIVSSVLTPEEKRIEVAVEQKFLYKVVGLAYLMPFVYAFLEFFWIGAYFVWGLGSPPNFGVSGTKIFTTFIMSYFIHNVAIHFNDTFSNEIGAAINKCLKELEDAGLKNYNWRLLKEEYARLWRAWNREMKKIGRAHV
jgi:hypothetical protein